MCYYNRIHKKAFPTSIQSEVEEVKRNEYFQIIQQSKSIKRLETDVEMCQADTKPVPWTRQRSRASVGKVGSQWIHRLFR